MFKKIFLALVAIIVIFAVVVAFQPANYRIVRSMKMAAAPDKVFPLVNDFHAWDAWSPWAKIDPNMKTTFSGPESGQGAIYHWTGNKEVGEGQMTLLESKPNELVRIKLDFIKPFADTCATDFTFTPDGDQTNVTWSMSGNRNYFGKAFCLIAELKGGMDKMIGDDFNKGLAKMKAQVEAKK